MKKTTCMLFLMFLGIQLLSAQTEIEKITTTLTHYIEGTANGEPERIAKAFHPDLNLYYVDGDSIKGRSGKRYIENFVQGVKKNRIGRIISIDYENDAAMAKAEIIMPKSKKRYIDYFLLLKEKGEWKIVHKSYTHHKFQE
ncbi:hypothetical protein IMCC3317_07990 [Kordia antarctica]|uniref:Lumazine-binding protein n=1 Tax=Kordia antarctica TaxID=1218801 RepID=A0A7L4ZFL0_9FLAO|nr:nuclear transport factor 2 family protein [Kordia antarctica]QHI35453.1 hypothetical protein IMCC3317_07990 [Kordia antarctica]